MSGESSETNIAKVRVAVWSQRALIQVISSVMAQVRQDSPVGVAEKRLGAFSVALKVGTPSPIRETPSEKP